MTIDMLDLEALKMVLDLAIERAEQMGEDDDLEAGSVSSAESAVTAVKGFIARIESGQVRIEEDSP